MKINLHSLLENWLYIWVLALCCFGMGLTFGGRAVVALRHNLRPSDVVVWYGRGNGSIQQYYLSTLIAYSIFWIAGGVICLLAGWVYSRKKLKQKL